MSEPIYVTRADKDRLLEVIFEAESGEYRNSEYTRRLRGELQRAHVVEPEQVPPDVITMNSRAALLDQETDEREEWTLVYPEDADVKAGKISVLAPVGAAMLGYRVGDVFEWETPGGKRVLKVEAILYQPEAAGDEG
jgi:regulator of nucleoside diphosphate kinase